MTPRAALLALLISSPHIASATVITMTFDGLTNSIEDTYVYAESGITATSNGDLRSEGGMAHIERLGPWLNQTSSIDFVTGSLFTPVSIDILALGSGYCDGPTTHQDCFERSEYDDPVPYIWISGFVDDALTAELGLYRQRTALTESLSLSWLGAVDLLRVEARNYFDLPDYDGFCTRDAYCGHFHVNNLVVQSVPEPETYALLMFGALGAWLSRRRRLEIEALSK